MKKHYLLILLMISLFTKTEAQSLDTKSNSLLWEVSGNGIKGSSYMVFTTPSICESTPSLLEKMSGLRNSITHYYTETGINNPAYREQAQKYAYLKNGEQSIRKLISAKNYLRLKSIMEEEKISEKLLNQFNSLMIYNILSKAFTPECNKANYTEDLFREYADQHSYKVDAIFSLTEAFDLLNGYGSAYYIAEIEHLLSNQAKVTQEIKKKAALYKTENLAEIEQLYKSSHFLNSRFQNADLEEKRISQLVKKMDAVIKSGGILITLDMANAFNSGFNVISEMRKLGYTVNAYKN
ncbi:TraB/GumN family protein [Pedobacter sp. MW01-1-1]|uniref:TraB/GumN family protein n=1 Tax=Pedobacter sp. MW01-1-1 TaxID=3383027 RepID=UPI003FEDEE18